ncbi:MAG TPA: succinate dehydrogenase flavoprotein subunit [Candidatus Binataceae bacterium]|nr:succinate dehydrogenase flavoprotein subunit [Candidatus Binataceae bacterium]
MPGHHIIVGGGLAGLTTAMKLAEQGEQIDLFSIVPVKRSHSVCAQGGINGAVNTKGEGDSPAIHFDDTIYGGDFLANQPPVKGMCEAAPGIIYLFDRMGVMFNRTPEGLLDFRRFGGTKHHRTAFAGATTGQQLLYALDEQVRRYEVAGQVRKFEGWEMLSVVLDESGDCKGICAIDNRSLEIRAFPADTVMIATGGPGLVFGRSTQSLVNTGSAASALYQQGATYANGEFIQVHPTAVPGEDKNRLISESIRGEGGRVWTYKDGKPWYFLEEMYPAYGNLVPRDIATRAIHKVVYEMGLGIDGQQLVYLDVSHIDPAILNAKVSGVLEIYEKFVGQDPRKVPMKIFPAMHYSMGGLWVDYKQQTNIKGLFASGECEYQYHGANRLGANSLLSCIYAGMIAAPVMIDYAKAHPAGAASRIHDQETTRQREDFDKIFRMNGSENAFSIWRELGDIMTENVTVVRLNDKLKLTDTKLLELKDRWGRIGLNDKGKWANQEVLFVRQLWNMIELARPITLGALNRNESRGAHYKPEFPQRDDKNFLKTTMATWSSDGPRFGWEAVDTSLIPLRARRYDVDTSHDKAKAA